MKIIWVAVKGVNLSRHIGGYIMTLVILVRNQPSTATRPFDLGGACSTAVASGLHGRLLAELLTSRAEAKQEALPG